MAAANPLVNKSCVFDFAKTSRCSRLLQANDTVMSNGESTELSPLSPNDRWSNKPEIKAKICEVIESFIDKYRIYVHQIEVHTKCEPHSSRFGRNCRVRVVNGMKSSGWLPSAVKDLLNFLVRDTINFTLIVGFPKDEPPNNNDSDLLWHFHFNWDNTGFICIVTQWEDGYGFKKDLILMDQPSSRDCHLMSVKWTNLCVTMDGENILLEPMHREKFVTIWEYHGKENDANSRHYPKGKPEKDKNITVFGFKLKNSNHSDVAMCLGVVDKMRVRLMPANIPEHGIVIKTKADPDHRFFYVRSAQYEHSTFESTQFENHYLAIEDTGAGPELCLKEVPEGKELDHDEILFDTPTHPK